MDETNDDSNQLLSTIIVDYKCERMDKFLYLK
jgi:hypothetical protein